MNRGVAVSGARCEHRLPHVAPSAFPIVHCCAPLPADTTTAASFLTPRLSLPMYGLNLPAVHLHQISKYCEKTGGHISSGRRYLDNFIYKALIQEPRMASKVHTLKGKMDPKIKTKNIRRSRMYGLNLPAVHLHQISKYCEKTGGHISSGRRY